MVGIFGRGSGTRQTEASMTSDEDREDAVHGSDALHRHDALHRKRLIGAWGMVADFCFGDLLLFVPEERSHEPKSFVVVAQVRPTTSQTLYQDDLVGRSVPLSERPLLSDAWRAGELQHGQNYSLAEPVGVRVAYIPVRRRLDDGTLRVVGVMTRELAPDVSRRPGRLERTYLEVFDALAGMITRGLFPFPVEEDTTEVLDPPRVGDGVIAIGTNGAITYASPNAMSALHRMGMYANPEGRPLSDLVGSETVLADSLARALPATIEFESEVAATAEATVQRVVLVLRVIPLVHDDGPSSAVVLMRDVSDVRRRDRLIVTKDATIREVHHRVKNNLQTISALLRLQGRRLESDEAKQAIEESVRRIRSIALVHETLSRIDHDAVPFDEIIRPLVRMVEEGLASPEHPIHFSVEGQLGDLPPETATPLVVVLTELLQNAVEHAFVAGTSAKVPGMISVRLSNDASELSIEVRDSGVGLPEGFSLLGSRSLGLSIVRTLVTTELGGAIAFRSEGGTVVSLRVPRVADPRTRHALAVERSSK
jgi:two-component system, sensor histidine kinase PdtaS